MYRRKINTTHKNILDIIEKLNTLTKYYSNIKHIQKKTYNLFLDIGLHEDGVSLNERYEALILRIDFYQQFYTVGLYDVYKNSPFANNAQRLKSLEHVVKEYVKMYFPEYFVVEQFINKLLYQFPCELKEDDFKVINEIYLEIKYRIDEKTKQAKKWHKNQ